MKKAPAKTGDITDMSSIPGSAKAPGGGNSNPFQYSCLENPMDRGAWWVNGPLGCKKWDMIEAA